MGLTSTGPYSHYYNNTAIMTLLVYARIQSKLYPMTVHSALFAWGTLCCLNFWIDILAITIWFQFFQSERNTFDIYKISRFSKFTIRDKRCSAVIEETEREHLNSHINAIVLPASDRDKMIYRISCISHMLLNLFINRANVMI